jgi:protein-S-isoprenylcysteine O-methyltransferase Ste14
VAKENNPTRQRIVRSEIRKDLLFFAVPALLLFTSGLVVSGKDGYDGLLPVIWKIIREPNTRDQHTTLNFVGLGLFIFGLTIALIAYGTLRHSYSSTLIIREDHQLLTYGIYRYTRHPIYLGVLIAIFGVPVYASSWAGMVIMACLIPIFLYRIKIEEELLIAEFGTTYQEYKETTSKLIPFMHKK